MMPLAETKSPAPFDAWRHRYAVACAVATGLLLLAGGLVTSTGSGLAVPDWPLSFGRVFPPMVGGVLFEHGHRLVAASVGVLTLVLAFWFARREARAWVRRLAYVAVGAILVQGLLGGLTVLLRLPPAVSVLHACLAQGFFCVVVILALATSKGFVARRPEALQDDGVPRLWALAAIATVLVHAQLILGAVMRHTGAGLAIPDFPLAFGRLVPPMASSEIAIHFAHRAGALVVAAAVLFPAVRILRRHPGRNELAAPARLLIFLVAVQILLGGATVLTRLAVVPATAHVVVGALLQAACLVVTVRAARARGGFLPAAPPGITCREGLAPAAPVRTAGSAA
ncbi:MAG: heme A synthase [Acidobacteria bacterium]|nr:heme A synthase [Acidobacteriota bacterium]